tara:strand:- start:34 stop:798 length:765 start_codon:yes stop_codon:yes gene_type:complete
LIKEIKKLNIIFCIFCISFVSCSDEKIVKESVIQVIVTATPPAILPVQVVPSPISTIITKSTNPKIIPKKEPTPTVIPQTKFIRPTPTPNNSVKRNQTSSKITEINLKQSTFEDSELGIKFNIPSTWKKNKKNNYEISFSGKQGNVWIKKFMYKDEINSIEDFYSHAREIPTRVSTFKEESTQLIEHKGVQAIKISGSFGKAYREHIFLSFSKSYSTMIVFTCNPDFLPEYAMIFDRILESVETTSLTSSHTSK